MLKSFHFILLIILMLPATGFAQYEAKQCLDLQSAEGESQELCVLLTSELPLSGDRANNLQLTTNLPVQISKPEAIWRIDDLQITSVPRKVIQISDQQYALDTLLLPAQGHWELFVFVYFNSAEYRFNIPLLISE